MDGKRLSAASVEYISEVSQFQKPVPVISGLVNVVGIIIKQTRHMSFAIISAEHTS